MINSLVKAWVWLLRVVHTFVFGVCCYVLYILLCSVFAVTCCTYFCVRCLLTHTGSCFGGLLLLDVGGDVDKPEAM